MKNLKEQISDLRKLLKKKKFSEARILCEKLLRNNQSHIELNFLLGFIYSKLHLNKRAEEQLLKVTYLDPNYYDAIVELSLVYEVNGDHAKASLFRERAFRISNKAEKT
jgi:tetratricopeptide (TPR) repeat protein